MDAVSPGPRISLDRLEDSPPALRLPRQKHTSGAPEMESTATIAGVGNRRYPLDGVGPKLTEEEIRQWIVAPRDMNPKAAEGIGQAFEG